MIGTKMICIEKGKRYGMIVEIIKYIEKSDVWIGKIIEGNKANFGHLCGGELPEGYLGYYFYDSPEDYYDINGNGDWKILEEAGFWNI